MKNSMKAMSSSNFNVVLITLLYSWPKVVFKKPFLMTAHTVDGSHTRGKYRLRATAGILQSRLFYPETWESLKIRKPLI